MRVTFENGQSQWLSTEAELWSALEKLDACDNTFFVLERTTKDVFQAALVNDAWWIEQYVAESSSHLRAFGANGSNLFSRPELLQITLSYFRGSDSDLVTEWRHSDETISTPSRDLLSSAPASLGKQADFATKVEWASDWVNYIQDRVLVGALAIIGVGFITILCSLIIRDLLH